MGRCNPDSREPARVSGGFSPSDEGDAGAGVYPVNGKNYTLPDTPASGKMRPMTTRRAFLQTLSTGVLASAAMPFGSMVPAWAATAPGEISKPFAAGLALQLYSLRHRFKAGDVDGALALTRAWGFRDVEGGAPEGMSAADFATRLETHGLSAMGTGADFNALGGDLGAAIKDAQALGAKYVMCAWIPHGKGFSLADAEKAVAAFNTAGARFRAEGLTFMYHIHGYEFVPGPDGTLFDTIAKRTDPDLVHFEMDVFWVVRGGGQPVELFDRYPRRFRATHLKDMKKGTAVGDSTGSAPDDTNVPIGQGTIDWPAVFRAAARGGVEWHIIEDESPEVEAQVPVSLRYIAGLKL